MVFGHRNFRLMFWILKLIYFPTITNEETYVAGGRVQQNRVLAGFRKSAPGQLQVIDFGSDKKNCDVIIFVNSWEFVQPSQYSKAKVANM